MAVKNKINVRTHLTRVYVNVLIIDLEFDMKDVGYLHNCNGSTITTSWSHGCKCESMKKK